MVGLCTLSRAAALTWAQQQAEELEQTHVLYTATLEEAEAEASAAQAQELALRQIAIGRAAFSSSSSSFFGRVKQYGTFYLNNNTKTNIWFCF
jgi:hypothetical protein